MMADALDDLPIPYPAKTKEATGLVNGIPTNVMSVTFSDKILVTITQEGRLAQWVTATLSLMYTSSLTHTGSCTNGQCQSYYL